MAHPDGFAIPARSTVELAPGGKHVMLIEPQPNAEGEIRLRLRFEKAGVVVVDAPVKTMIPANDEDKDEEDR